MLIAKRGKWYFCFQNLSLGALSSRSAPSVLVGELFKKYGIFFEHSKIQENAIRELRVITGSAFQEAFQQWMKRWQLCIDSREDYCERDNA